MCTVVILRRPGHPWPLLLAANRDEMKDRPWEPPGRHWPERPGIVAGRDVLAGGSWLGMNDAGVVAAVLNRVGSLGPQAGRRSRGELVLRALEQPDASAAATWVSNCDPAAYRSFNMTIADRQNAYWLRHRDAPADSHEGAPKIDAFELPAGLSMITAHDRNDPASARVRAYLGRFESATPPDPKKGTWGAWKRILANRRYNAADGPLAAMTVVTDSGFETVCSSLIALPGPPQSLRGPRNTAVWLFAPGRPDETPYQPVEL